MTATQRLAALAFAGSLLLGCGPVEYLTQVSGRAAAALAQAKREGGEEAAPYEVTIAGEYLKKAREDASRSSYESSIEYGRKAEEFANRALAIARQKSIKHRADVDDPPPHLSTPGSRP